MVRSWSSSLWPSWEAASVEFRLLFGSYPVGLWMKWFGNQFGMPFGESFDPLVRHAVSVSGSGLVRLGSRESSSSPCEVLRQ
jgi:hypothetical protein